MTAIAQIVDILRISDDPLKLAAADEIERLRAEVDRLRGTGASLAALERGDADDYA